MMNWFENCFTLVQKNYLMIARNRKYLFFFLLSPIAVIIYLFIYQQAFENVLSSSHQIDGPLSSYESIPHCYGPDCITLGYAIIGESQPAWIEAVMKIIAERQNLVLHKDIQILSASTASNFKNWIEKNENKTQVAVIFCTDNWDVEFEKGQPSQYIPCQFTAKNTDKELVFYTIAYNMTIGYENPYFHDVLTPYPVNKVAMATKRAVDEAIL
jgi:hypothetical protein